MEKENEIILYQPDSLVSLEVRVENETVWLTQQQIADLFGVKRPAITKHLSNIFQSEELDEKSVCSILERTASDGKIYATKFYNLDAILSVGYRVNSKNATLFRQWANRVLKEYLLKGYAVNQRISDLANSIDNRFYRQQCQIDELKNRVDLIITSNIPPKEGIFFEGEIFDAYSWLCDRMKEAKRRIVIIDNYVDYTVLKQLAFRNREVEAIIYTHKNNKGIFDDIKKYNAQYQPVELKIYNNVHDRFLIIDEMVYHVGGSFKDLGKKITAYSILSELTSMELLERIEKNN